MSKKSMAEIINIYDELKDLECNKLINLERKNVYTYPEGYFNELPENVMRNVWLQSLTQVMPYAVPVNYFDNLPELIIDKASLSSLDNFNHKTLYKLPEGYFESLADKILQKIKYQRSSVQNELESISPLLSKIPKINVFTVPEGYFESRISNQPKTNNSTAKVISIAGRSRKWFGYAAAACIAVVMLVSGYFYYQSSSSDSLHNNKLAEVNVQNAISQLSDSTIDNYLQNDYSDAYLNPNIDMQEVNVQTLIENVPDDEIENYLIQNAEPIDKTNGM